MSDIIWGIDMNNSTTSWNLDKRLCKATGEMCELATEFGYCQITACIKHNLSYETMKTPIRDAMVGKQEAGDAT